MTDTPNLKLPYLSPSQAQKHVTVNDGLRTLDAVVQLSVLDADLNTPPLSPLPADRYIIAATATGVRTGHEDSIAAWQDGAWMFYPPKQGWLAWVEDEDQIYAYTGSAWVTASASNSPANFSINTGLDANNRLSVQADSILFSHDATTPGSGDTRTVLNKVDASATASLIFQTGFSGRAEFGTIGNDDWHVKVSPDGTNCNEALTVDKYDGKVTISQGLVLPDGVKISNAGTTSTAGVEIEGGGILGKVALIVKNDNGLAGALFEQRSDHPANIDLIDFGLRTLTEQINLRVESRSQFTISGSTPEFQIGDVSQNPIQNLFAISPKQALVRVPLALKNHSVSTLPSATPIDAGALVYVSDKASGAVPAFSDGTNWRSITDRVIVS